MFLLIQAEGRPYNRKKGAEKKKKKKIAEKEYVLWGRG